MQSPGPPTGSGSQRAPSSRCDRWIPGQAGDPGARLSAPDLSTPARRARIMSPVDPMEGRVRGRLSRRIGAGDGLPLRVFRPCARVHCSAWSLMETRAGPDLACGRPFQATERTTRRPCQARTGRPHPFHPSAGKPGGDVGVCGRRRRASVLGEIEAVDGLALGIDGAVGQRPGFGVDLDDLIGALLGRPEGGEIGQFLLVHLRA